MPSAETPSRWASARCPHVRPPPTPPVEGGARPVAAEPAESSQPARAGQAQACGVLFSGRTVVGSANALLGRLAVVGSLLT